MSVFARLQPRIRDVLTLAPIPLIMVIAHPISAWVLFVIVGFVALHEWRRIVSRNRLNFYTNQTRFALISFICAMIASYINIYLGLLIILGSAYYVYVCAPKLMKFDMGVGQVAIGLVAVLAYTIRDFGQHNSIGLILFGLALIITITSDSAAYFVGKKYGKTKFAPVISPNKTWEGAVGGWVFAIIAAMIYCAFLVPPIAQLNIIFQIILFWFMALAGQMGDLGESAFKRKYGVKDSGQTLRSHGGVLDRFDSIGPVLVLLWLGLWVLL